MGNWERLFPTCATDSPSHQTDACNSSAATTQTGAVQPERLHQTAAQTPAPAAITAEADVLAAANARSAQTEIPQPQPCTHHAARRPPVSQGPRIRAIVWDLTSASLDVPPPLRCSKASPSPHGETSCAAVRACSCFASIADPPRAAACAQHSALDADDCERQ